MSSTIDGKEFTCPKCGGHDLHEEIKGYCKLTLRNRGVESDCGAPWFNKQIENKVLAFEFYGDEEVRCICADCGRELDDPKEEEEEENE